MEDYDFHSNYSAETVDSLIKGTIGHFNFKVELQQHTPSNHNTRTNAETPNGDSGSNSNIKPKKLRAWNCIATSLLAITVTWCILQTLGLAEKTRLIQANTICTWVVTLYYIHKEPLIFGWLYIFLLYLHMFNHDCLAKAIFVSNCKLVLSFVVEYHGLVMDIAS